MTGANYECLPTFLHLSFIQTVSGAFLGARPQANPAGLKMGQTALRLLGGDGVEGGSGRGRVGGNAWSAAWSCVSGRGLAAQKNDFYRSVMVVNKCCIWMQNFKNAKRIRFLTVYNCQKKILSIFWGGSVSLQMLPSHPGSC